MQVDGTMHPYSRTYFHKGTRDEAVLLLHGFTATPAQMRPLAEALAAEGYTVRAILLPGHGETLAAMERTTWRDWLGAAEAALREMMALHPRVDVVGLSMGGLIALNLAARFPVNRAVCISTPARIQGGRLAPFAPVLKFLRRYQSWGAEPTLAGELGEPYTEGYPGYPVHCVRSLDTLRRDTWRRLPDVKAPLMIVQSGHDSAVAHDSPYLIYDRVSSVYRELLLLERSRHVATLGPEREHLFADVARFLALPDETVAQESRHHARRPEAAGAPA